jgi:hypothetical protein
MTLNLPKVIGLDVETDLIRPGCLTPELVCVQVAGGEDTLDAANEWLAENTGSILTEPSTISEGHVWARLRVTTKHGLEWEIVTDKAHGLDLAAWAALTADVTTAHNQTFDWAVLCNEFPEMLPLVTALLEQGQLGCTMVREQLTAIGLGRFKYDERTRRKDPTFSLAYVVAAYFGVDISASKSRTDKNGKIIGNVDSWRLRYITLKDTPICDWPLAALTYASSDSIWGRRVYLAQAKPLKLREGVLVHEDGRVQNESEQEAAAWALHLMACHGVYTRRRRVDVFEKEVTVMVRKAVKAGTAAGFCVINSCKVCLGTGQEGEVPRLIRCTVCEGKSHEDCLEQGLYGHFKNGKPKTTAAPKTKTKRARLQALLDYAYHEEAPLTKRPKDASPTWKAQTSTDTDSLKGSGNALLEEYAEGSSAQKLLGTYLPILRRGQDLPITSRPNVLVRSGRTSWRDPNFQNPPAKGGFRACFKPRPGTVFASIDYAALELTTLAQTCLQLFGYSKMAEAINEGKDLHLAFAAEYFLRLPYEAALSIYQDTSHPRFAEVKDRRQRAKVANFGIPGGLGVEALVSYAKGYGLNLTYNDADELIKAWKEQWPVMKEYFKMMSQAARSGIEGRFTVRQLGSGRLRAGCSYTSGANTYFQGLAADGAKAAMWQLYKACYLDTGSPLHGVRMWAFIHDEFMFEGPEETAHLWAPEASRIMVEAMGKYTPDVKQAAEPCLMDTWSKKAETLYDATGKLLVWREEAA